MNRRTADVSRSFRRLLRARKIEFGSIVTPRMSCDNRAGRDPVRVRAVQPSDRCASP